MAGNKSGALLLTIFELTTGAATNGLPSGSRLRAVQDGNGKIGELPEASHDQSRPGVTVIVARTRLGAVRNFASQPVPTLRTPRLASESINLSAFNRSRLKAG